MPSAAGEEPSAAATRPPPRPAVAFHLAVNVPVTALAVLSVVLVPGDFAGPALLRWVLAAVAAGLIPLVPAGAGLTLSLPVLIAAAVLHTPAVAAAIGFLSAAGTRGLLRRPPLASWSDAAQRWVATGAGALFATTVAGASPSGWRLLLGAAVATVPLGGLVLARLLYDRNRALTDRLAEQNQQLTGQARQLEGLLAEVSDKEERFRALIQNTSDVILVVGADGVVEYQSPSAERGFGYGPDTLAGSSLDELLHPDDQRRALRLLDEAIEHPGATAPAEWRMRHPRGLWQHVEVIGRNLIEDPRVGGIVLTIRSIEERRALSEQLRHQAFHDALTGLANRSLFRDRVDHALSRRGAPAGSVAVLFIDLDDFKVVNDSLGHQAGDQLLLTVAERLRACLRPMDTAARLGG